jgi:hypothetical protein
VTGAASPAQLIRRFHSGLLLKLLLFASIFSLAAVPPVDPDLWWHLANGRLLKTLGWWPQTDLYSFSAGGHPWVMHEWLSDLVMYGLHQVGGLPLLVVIFAAMVTAGAACLFLILRWSGLHPTAAVGLTLSGALAGSTAWGARPQLLNLLFSGVLICGLLIYRQGRLTPWWLIPFVWIWANLHSGFLVGIIITLLFLVGEGIDRSFKQTEVSRPRLVQLGVALLAGTALSLVNPYGLDALLFPLGTLTSPLIQNNIQEWASPDFHSLPGYLLEVILFLVLLGLATGRVKARTSDWLWALALLYLAFSSQRHVPLFVLAGAPLLGRCAQALIDHAGSLMPEVASHQAPRAAFRWSPARPGGSSVWLGAVNLVLLVVVSGGMVSYRALPNIRSEGQAAAIRSSFPVKAADALLAEGRPMRVFNHYDLGGYLVWRLYPSGGRVFIDGRVEVYGSEVFKDYLTVNYVSSGWREVIARWHPDAVLLPSGHPVVTLLEADPSWRVLEKDRNFTLFTAHSSQ